MDYERLKSIDFQHIWHPFTQAQAWFEEDPLIVERAEGMELVDVNGKRYLDGVSSLWCNVHGHHVPELLDAIKQQSEKVCHSTLLGLSHRPVIELTERLVKILPEGLTKVFYSDSGSAAVEAALRMCLEWWQKQRNSIGKNKNRLVSLDTAYHGDTLGAVGVGYVQAFHEALRETVIPAYRLPPPHIFRFYEGCTEAAAAEQSLAFLKSLFKKSADEIAAMIIEPLVQGAAGIWLHSEEYLREVGYLCRAHDVLLIADEVATGFGKTGKMFAVERARVQPDVLVMGKGLSGGTLPISAIAASEKIFSGFLGKPEELKTFFYGQTFCGNPLAAAVSSANLDLFSSTKLLENLPSRITLFHKHLDEKVAPLPHVSEIRKKGVMIGIELTVKKGLREAFPIAALAGARVTRAARERGVVIRPLGNTLVLMPPLAMSEPDLIRLVDVTAEALRVLERT